MKGRWQQPFVLPTANPYGAMAASCPTASKCYVVGSLFTPSAHQLAYVASFVGGRWTSQFFYLGRGESSTEMKGADRQRAPVVTFRRARLAGSRNEAIYGAVAIGC